MAIADGRIIVIRFTQPLVGNVYGNESKFTVSFDEYNYVPEGKTSHTEREVTLIKPFMSVDTVLDLSSGIYNGIECFSGSLGLAIDKGV